MLNPKFLPIYLKYLAGYTDEPLASSRKLLETASEDEEVYVFHLRLLIESVKPQEALAFFQTILPQLKNPLRIRQAKLWITHNQGFGIDAENTWQSLHELAVEQPRDPYLDALSQDLIARAEAWQLNFGLIPYAKQAEIYQRLRAAATAYGRVGALLEKLLTLKRAANFCFRDHSKLLKEGEAALEEMFSEAQTTDWPILKAEASLGLIRYRVNGQLSTGNPLDTAFTEDLQQQVDATNAFFQQADHAYGNAKIAFELGSLFLKYAIPYGEDLLKEAIAGFQQVREVLQEQSAWRDLSVWYTRQGRWIEADEAQAKAQSLQDDSMLELGTQVNNFAQAEAMFRRGETGAAIDFVRGHYNRNRNNPFAMAFYATLLGNFLNSMGLKKEALAVIDEAASKLRLIGPSAGLSQLLQVGAQTAGWTEGLPYIDEAIAIEETAGNQATTAEYLQARAWMLVQSRRLSGNRPFLNEAAERDFEAAEQALQNQFHFDALLALGNVYQMRGLGYFMDKNWEKCGEFLGKAERWFEAYGMKTQLAYTLSQQGLVLIDMARQRGVEYYEHARSTLLEAQAHFQQIPVPGELWRVAFHIALCAWESGQRMSHDDPEQKDRWIQAETEFLLAAGLLDELRGYVAGGQSANQQSMAISFARDKQTLYDTGMQLALFGLQDYARAFSWLERLKSRVFLDALAEQVRPDAALLNHPDVQRETDLQQQLWTVTDPSVRTALRKEMDALLDNMSNQAELFDYARLRKGEVIDWPDLRIQLQREEQGLNGRRMVLLAYWHDNGRVWVLGLRSDWESPQMKPLAQVSINDLQHLSQAYFRKKNGVRFLLEDLGEAPWQQFADLVQPLEDWSAPGDIVGFIPFGHLHDLPLHTLKIGNQYCIERNPVFYAPSASILSLLWKRMATATQDTPGTSIALGNPSGDLAHAAEEAAAVARFFGVEPVAGTQVTKALMLASLQSARKLHFAGHGYFDATDGLQSSLLLANGERLTAAELLSLPMKTEKVVLSGCETALQQHFAGDEGLGLVRAFLYRQVHQVIAAQWRISDATAYAILSDFYQQANVPAAVALQQAILHYRKIYPHASFYHWGSFVVHGDFK